MSITIGSTAPKFTLFDTTSTPRSLSEFHGKKVVLAFYPGAFTGVCTKELCAFRDVMSQFNSLNAQVVGISVDSPFANKAFSAQNNLQFPLLSDYTREVSKQYGGVHDDFAGLKGYSTAKRAVFIIDETGKVIYTWVSESPGVEPDYTAISQGLK
jgi:glutaredoxin-dependent peroxiredoxin